MREEAVNVPGRRVLEDDGSQGNMVADVEDLRPVLLCGPCRSGAGGECHMPGCALCNNRAPDIPISGDLVDDRAELLERWLGWIRRSCQRNLDGEKAATYRGIVNFIDRNLPDAAQRVASEEEDHRQRLAFGGDQR